MRKNPNYKWLVLVIIVLIMLAVPSFFLDEKG